MTADNACDGGISPNFALLISGKVSVQWLETQSTEKPGCTTWLYISLFLVKQPII